MTIPLLPTQALRSVLLWAAVMAVYSYLVVWLTTARGWSNLGGRADELATLEAAGSLAIGLLLAFRMNRAFDRWWEARTLWGTLVNASRNMAVKTNNVVLDRDESAERLTNLLVAFPYALRDHLRGKSISLPPSIPIDAGDAQHKCAWIANQIYGVYELWKREQRIQYGEFRMLDREAKVLLEVCGGCERIRNTPIALSFRVLVNHLLAFFLLTLPWGLAGELGTWTVPLAFLASYFLIAAEGLADHVEQPFQQQGDGLDLDGICRSIEASVREIMATDTQARGA